MPAGTEYPRELIDKASRSKVMLVVIGERWDDDTNGLRLLADPADWVRRGIAMALANRTQVVPVLVGARGRLVSADLPEDIQRIAYLQSRHLHSGDDEHDVRCLVGKLLRELPDGSAQPRSLRFAQC